MDPLTAVSLASNAIQVLDRITKMGLGTEETTTAANQEGVPTKVPLQESGIDTGHSARSKSRTRFAGMLRRKIVAQSDFLNDLNGQGLNNRKRGRVAVLNDPDARNGSGPRFEINSYDPGFGDNLFVDKFLSEDTRLVIMEDMGASWVKRIAKLLRLPEYLFALHWRKPTDHVLGNIQIPLMEDPRRHFILQYRQPLPFKITKPRTGEDERLACNAQRTVVRRSRALRALQIEDIETSEQLVSFFCGNFRGREIAVLLVDPCPSLEDQYPNGSAAVQKAPRPHVEISQNKKEWHDWDEEYASEQSAHHTLSMYDELVQYFFSLSQEQALQEFSQADSLPPYAWANYCCNIVLAKNASTVQSSFVETWKLIGKASTGVKKLADFDFDKLERKAWSDEWKGEFFTQLWELREELELTQYKLEMNKQVLSRLNLTQDPGTRFGNVTISGSDSHVYVGDTYTQYHNEVEAKTAEGKGKVPLMGGIGSLQPSYGAEGFSSMAGTIQHGLAEWDRLLKMNGYAIQLMDRTTETYVQAIGATATQFANEQTKNSKKLTGFAAVFVPASLCAAILAIPSFTPDARSITKFWVFWVVSVPLAIILAIFFLTDLPQWIKRQWQGRSSQRSEDDLKEAVANAATNQSEKMPRARKTTGIYAV